MTGSRQPIPTRQLRSLRGVATRGELRRLGVTSHQLAAQLDAQRWSRVGPAIVLHNATPTLAQYRRICLINCGPRALLTSLTSAEEHGLRGWEQVEVHVLAPAGTRRPAIPGLRLHRVGDWTTVARGRSRRLVRHRLHLQP